MAIPADAISSYVVLFVVCSLSSLAGCVPCSPLVLCASLHVRVFVRRLVRRRYETETWTWTAKKKQNEKERKEKPQDEKLNARMMNRRTDDDIGAESEGTDFVVNISAKWRRNT